MEVSREGLKKDFWRGKKEKIYFSDNQLPNSLQEVFYYKKKVYFTNSTCAQDVYISVNICDDALLCEYV